MLFGLCNLPEAPHSEVRSYGRSLQIHRSMWRAILAPKSTYNIIVLEYFAVDNPVTRREFRVIDFRFERTRSVRRQDRVRMRCEKSARATPHALAQPT